MNESLRKSYEQLLDRLRRVRKKEALAAFLQWAGILISFLLLSVVLALAAETALSMSIPARTVIFWTIVVVSGFLLARAVVPPLLVLAGVTKGKSEREISRGLGEKIPSIRDRLLNALQLAEDNRNKSYYSEGLTDRAFEDLIRQSREIDFERVVDLVPAKRSAMSAGAVVVLTLLLLLFFPSPFSGAADRLWNFGVSYQPPPPFRFIVEPGNAEVIKGDSVLVHVVVDGRPQGSIRLNSKPSRQAEYDRTDLESRADGTFRHIFESLKATTEYYLEADGIRSDEFQLSVIDRPIVRMLRLTITPPRYSGLPSRELDDHIGDVTALKGTEIDFHIEATKPLAGASLVFSPGAEKKLLVEGTNAVGTIRLSSDVDYKVRLVDENNLDNPDPVMYQLRIVADRPRRASIDLPGKNLDVAGNENLAMVFRITDDFGFTRLRLGYRLVESRYEAPATSDSFADLVIPSGIRSEGLVSFNWALETLHLVPEDVVSYYVEVFDNDNISGPKSGKSETYTLRLPSLEEVIAGVDEQQEVSAETLREAIEESEQAREDLTDLQQEIRKNPQQMDWQEQKQAEELLEKYQEIQAKVEKAAETLAGMMEKMEENQLLSPETLEKYAELQELLEQLNSPELAEALKQLQESFQDYDPETMREVLENLNLTEEQFRKSLERTLNLLRRIQIEQKIDEAIRRTEEMMDAQEALQEETAALEESGEEEKADKTGEQQRDLGKQVDQLKAMLENLEKMMEEFASDMPLEEMESAMSRLDSTKLSEDMKEIAEQIGRMEMSEAKSGQQQAMQDMGRFLEDLNEMRDALRQDMQQEIVNEMRKAYQELLELSKQEEALKDETAQVKGRSPVFRESEGKQMEVLRGLGRVAERLSAVAQKTFGVTPEMGKAVGDAMHRMNEAMKALGERNASKAASEQEAAMAALNEAAQQVQAGMNAMMQGGGQGMGMAGLMQRLQSLTGMQQGVNRGTKHLGGLGEQRAGEMGRLAGEQGMVRKSLEQLAREASLSGEMSKLLGDLGRAAQEMREVQTDLAQGNVQPETLRKQDRILSRLLDSQRSLRERDYENKRKAEAGRQHTREHVPEIDLTSQESLEQLRQDLLKAMEEGYSADYQRLIRLYFEKLESVMNPN